MKKSFLLILFVIVCFVSAENTLEKEQKQKLKEYQLSIRSLPTANRIAKLEDYHDALHRERLQQIQRVLDENENLSTETKESIITSYDNDYKTDSLVVKNILADKNLTADQKDKQIKIYIKKQYKRFNDIILVKGEK